jgi:hypothetical protein
MSAMIGPLLLLAAAYSPHLPPPAQASVHSPKFAPTSTVTARARASVKILAGVSFGPGRSAETPGATLRSARLVDQAGQPMPAKLLEFQ